MKQYNELNSAEESFRIGWKEMLEGKTRPISELCDGCDING